MRLLVILVGLLLVSTLHAKEVPFTLEDRDRLIRMETELKALSKSVDVRFEETNKRMDAKFEEVNRKIDMLFNFLWIISGVFTAITVATIGFAIWDRKSAVKPLDDRVRRLEDREDVFLNALRKLAEKDRELFELLKKQNLL